MKQQIRQGMTLFTILFASSLPHLAPYANAAQPSAKATRLGCNEEIGTEVPSVGKYILATRSANATISPGQCLFSSNTKYIAWNQPSPEGNFVVYPTDNVSTSAHRWSHGTSGQPTIVIVQNDGHFVAYPTSKVSQRNGSYHGDSRSALAPTPTNASSVDSYFLIMQDNGILGLYRGPNPAQNIGLIWQSGAPPQEDYCLSILSASGSVLNRIDARSNSPVLAFGKGTPEVEVWNRRFPGNANKALNFVMALGMCQ